MTTGFGDNAGMIWRALNEKGSLNKSQLLEITQLTENELHAGLGWLARENKICREGEDIYRLDNTNLAPEFGKNAGKVFKIMDIWGEVDPPILKRLVGADEKEIYSALGWLAREDKICADEKSKFNLK
ncbi:MAG: hypothetical protein DRN27_07905 [Thermoplasmata archaeon]|nr:MAG: hypothetical protein DRN27_07905 [Thermoplasmata archaeon]